MTDFQIEFIPVGLVGTAIASGLLLGGAIIFSGSKRAAVSGTSTALRYTGLGAGAAGVIAGFNEYGATRREAVMVRLEKAYGIEHEGDNPRRQAMEEIVYNAENVPDAIIDIRSCLDESGELISSLSGQQIIELNQRVAQMRTLLELGDRQQIDLLQFSGVSKSFSERLDLMQALAEAEAAIDKRVAEGGTIEIESPDGTKVEVDAGVAIREAALDGIQNTEQAFTQDYNARLHAYRRLMAQNVARAVVIGTVTGAAAGFVIQEGIAAIRPEITGVLGQQLAGHPNTMLESLIHGQHNTGRTTEIIQSLNKSHLITHEGTALHLSVPEGVHAEFTAGDHLNLLDAKGNVIAEHLGFNKSGELTRQSIGELQKLGIKPEQTVHIVQGHAREVGAEEYLKINKHEIVTSNNHLMMNDTPRPDLNELHMQAGGENGSWFDARGDVVIRVDGLSPAGSFEGATHVNPLEALHDGSLKVFMSPFGGNRLEPKSGIYS